MFCVSLRSQEPWILWNKERLANCMFVALQEMLTEEVLNHVAFNGAMRETFGFVVSETVNVVMV